jgi:FkbM family methyltransferase
MTAATGFDAADVATADARYGRLAYFREDDPIGVSLRLYGEWAQLELDVLLQLVRPGDTVVDAGANVGTHAVAFARAAGGSGRVLAFEPQPRVFELLERNVRANGYDNVSVYRFALGSERTARHVLPLDYAAHVNVGAVSLVARPDAGSSGVDVVPLDSLELDTVRLIKIDVEGMECEVLRGAARTLRRCRPFVSVECNSVEAGDAVLAALRDQEFAFYFLRTPAYNPANHRANPMNRFGAATESNLLCVPRELEGVLAGGGAELRSLARIASAPDLARAFEAGPRRADDDELQRLRYRVAKHAFELEQAERRAEAEIAREAARRTEIEARAEALAAQVEAHGVAAEAERLHAASAEERAADAGQRAADAEQRAAHAEQRAGDGEQRAAQAEHHAANVEQRAAVAEQQAAAAQQQATLAEQRAADAEQRAAHAEQHAANAEQTIARAEQRTSVAEQHGADAEQRAVTAEQRAVTAEQRAAGAEQRATLLGASAAEAHVGALAAEQRAVDAELHALDAEERAVSLEDEVHARDVLIASLVSSRSWRLTLPFRRVMRALRRGGDSAPPETPSG